MEFFRGKSLLLALILVGPGAAVAVAGEVSQAAYDVVILGGRVMDPETHFDGVRNVGISDGRIVTITANLIAGAETINAHGHVVAPGFIDGHQHGTDAFSRKINLRDGLTTGMDYEAGARDIGKWYAEADGKTQANYGMVVNAAYARIAVLDGPEIAGQGNDIGDLFATVAKAAVTKARQDGRKPGWCCAVASEQQLHDILAILDEGLRQGAAGIGIPAGYMKAGVTAQEMFSYQQLAGLYGRLSNGHARFAGRLPPTQAALGIQEMLSNAIVLDAPFMAAHLNSIQDWQFTIPLINSARARGAKVWGEVYPYAAGSTLAAAEVISKDQMPSMGISYEDIASLDGTRWTKAIYDDVRRNDPGRPIIVYINKVEAIAKWLTMPGVVIVSDGMPVQDKDGNYYAWGSPYEGKSTHPRSSGTRAKVLRMVREQQLMPLMEAISKMSYLHAKYFEELGGITQFRSKGRLQEGADADIVVFNPDTVTDNSSYKPGDGALPSTGIPYVLVNGITVVRDSKVLPVFPGEPIRFPVLSRGKLDQLTALQLKLQ